MYCMEIYRNNINGLFWLLLDNNSPFAKLTLVPITSYLLLCFFGNTTIYYVRYSLHKYYINILSVSNG